MKRFLLIVANIALVNFASGQSSDTVARKGSYLYYGQPSIEDNSMFIEEAFNQESGVIQHISNLIVSKGDVTYSYTQEIPLADVKHQLSFTFAYNSFKRPEGTSPQFKTQGLGDMLVNYRPLLFGKNDWALVIPRFTLIVPTGDARYGFGNGAWGGQFNLAVTKRVGRKFVTHYNAGFTKFSNAQYFQSLSDQPTLAGRKDLSGYNAGASVIWFATSRLNFMVEHIENFQDEFADDGSVLGKNRSTIINPGIRCAIDIGKVQIVPGIGIPMNFANGKYDFTGAFFYLSIEPAY